MGEFVVHDINFYNFKPEAIHRLAFEESSCRLALSRSDNSIEIYDLRATPYREKVIPASSSRSVVDLLWFGTHLFSTGFHGDLTEYDLNKLCSKKSYQVSAGACWCMKLSLPTNILAIGTEDGYVSLYEMTDTEVNFLEYLDKQKERILCLAWHPSGDYLASGSLEIITIWHIKKRTSICSIQVGRREKMNETVIWNIVFTSDFYIISGDSNGTVSFWNGKFGTLVESFKTHKADVLTLCMNKAEDTIFASGIDPLLLCFERIKGDSSSKKKWVTTRKRTYHTHDVRAITFANDYLISGGVDTYLHLLNLHNQTVSVVSPLPQSPVIHYAAKVQVVLLQYPHYLELWRLGKTMKEYGLPDEILPLSEQPLKMLTLNIKGSEAVVCSNISHDAQWLAYSTTDKFRMFKIEMDLSNVLPKLTVIRIKYVLPEGSACHHMAFASNSANLFLALSTGDIQVVEVIDTDTPPKLLSTLTSPLESHECIHLMAVSSDGKYLATADHLSNIHIYNNRRFQVSCTLPKNEYQPTAMAFSPFTSNLVVTYTNHQILEYSIKAKKFTSWTTSTINFYVNRWYKKASPSLHISFDERNSDNIIVHDHERIWIINKTEVLQASMNKSTTAKQSSKKARKSVVVQESTATEPDESEQARKARKGFHSSSKYQHLLHFGVLDDNVAVAVEVSRQSIINSLPDKLAQKKFGT